MKKIIIIAVGVLLGITAFAVACTALAGTAANQALHANTASHSSTSAPASTHTATAVPAVTQTSNPAPAGTLSEREALQSAQEYISMEAFSKAGLIDQLSSSAGEGFPKADAVWAVKHLHVSWFAEAVKSAKDYLSMEAFSRSGLIDQLSSSSGEGFTYAQATYAADKVGL